ncbi:MAG: Do family serine endopeptidase [Gemmatimonadetes bacterium]|nr:Do family serine endopeptidase [Gemmatimonadota bacterium]
MLDPVRAKARIIGFTAIAFMGGVVLASGMEWTAGSHAAALLQSPPAAREVRPVAELSEAFVAISESVTPAVVNIQVERPPRSSAGSSDLPESFRRFFEMPEGDREPRPQQGAGSGFLISADGYILTNNHVVEDATAIKVILKDRREFLARVIGRDPNTDIAVIKLEGTGFPSVRLGDPEQTRVGEWVLAIGNPLGNLDFTVTAGIVSAKGRPLGIIGQTTQSSYTLESFIQTDAAINPGNSGGPLVNIRGEVIGVNSAIASNTGFYEGYGFAVPIDIARRVGEDLIRYGKVRRPILGVSIQDVSVEDAEYYRLPSVGGILVEDFSMENSPAQRAGLRSGDVIVAVNGNNVTQVNELQRRIASLNPGDRVTLEVIRGGDRQRLQVQLAEAPSTATQIAAESPAARAPTQNGLGIEVAPLTAETARGTRFQQLGGLLVVDVEPLSPADRKGISEGRLKVVSVDGQAVNTVAEYQRLVNAKRSGQIVSLTVQTDTGANRIVNIRMP